MAELVFFRRGEEVLRFNLDEKRVVLGRGERCEVVIPDPEVSRQQVAVSVDGAGARATDLSGKGTIVSGKRISTEVALGDGAEIALGQWKAVFRTQRRDEAEATHVEQAKTQVAPLPSPRVVSVQVRVRTGTKEKVHRLNSDSFTVGKDSGNDLVLDDKFTSGRHLKVARRDGYFLVADQGSTNGTWLGNARIHEAEVPLFSTIRVGEAQLTIEPSGSGERREAYCGIIGDDPSVKQLAELIEKVAPSSAAVAIFGESGTGKELVAKAVHTRSTRKDRAFIPVNCAAISKELIESELFGHEKGAFTGAMTANTGAFEEADGGTLFLDEIGELPLELQAKLLRALESGEIKRVGAPRPLQVDVRIVAATNRDLLQSVKRGEFREDLYYRLCVIPLHLAPLRSRRGDIPAIAEHFVKAFAPKGQDVRFTAEALHALCDHPWPGNIRELRNAVHRALLLRRGPFIDAGDLSFDVARASPSAEPPAPVEAGAEGQPLEARLQVVEKQLILATLRKHDGNREKAARELGLSRSSLFKRLKDWGITNSDE